MSGEVAEKVKAETTPEKLTIEVSGEAQKELKEILKAQKPGLSIRVFVQLGGGGCGGGGAQFGMALDSPKNGDKTVQVDGINLIVDPYSVEYLNGANIDFVKEGDETGFKIVSPNMPSSHGEGGGCGSGGCGCGSGGCGCGS